MEQIEANIAVLLTVHDRKNKTLRCLENLYKQVLPNYLRLDIYLTDDEQSRVIRTEHRKRLKGNSRKFILSKVMVTYFGTEECIGHGKKLPNKIIIFIYG